MLSGEERGGRGKEGEGVVDGGEGVRTEAPRFWWKVADGVFPGRAVQAFGTCLSMRAGSHDSSKRTCSATTVLWRRGSHTR